jgi:hypothetical protein
MVWNRGADVLVLDRGEKMAGSRAAACLMKPSWLTKLGDKATIGMEQLDQLYGLKQVDFKIGPIHTNLSWVPPSQILVPVPEDDTVERIDEAFHVARRNVVAYSLGEVGGQLVLKVASGSRARGTYKTELVTCDAALVAAGVWSRELIPTVPPIEAMRGNAQLYKGQIDQPFVSLWAPYRQLTAFNITGEYVWGGDAQAIKAARWDEMRSVASRTRVDNALPPELAAAHERTIPGLRPYVEGHKTGYFDLIGNNLYISTGGAKNGTVIAAYQAKEFADAVMPLKEII